MQYLRAILAVAILGGAAYYYGIPRLPSPSSPSPEQSRRQGLIARRDDLRRQIADREAFIAADERAVTAARLASFRAQHRGDEAKVEGKKLRDMTEMHREENIHQLNRLRNQLVELEMELRGLE